VTFDEAEHEAAPDAPPVMGAVRNGRVALPVVG